MKLEQKRCYQTDILTDDWRPIFSEQLNTRNIIFTMDDTSVVYDIRGDNKLVFMDWKEEVSDLFPE